MGVLVEGGGWLWGHMARVFVCVSAHYLLPVFAQKVTQQLAQVRPPFYPPPLCLQPPNPRAAGCDIIDLWSRMGVIFSAATTVFDVLV